MKQLSLFQKGVPTKCQNQSAKNFWPDLKTGCIPEPGPKPLELLIERLNELEK